MHTRSMVGAKRVHFKNQVSRKKESALLKALKMAEKNENANTAYANKMSLSAFRCEVRSNVGLL